MIRIPPEKQRALFNAVGYQPHPRQQIIHDSDARWRVVCNGRRFGKTYLAAAEALSVALVGGRAMIVGPTHLTSTIAFNQVSDFVFASDAIRSLVTKQNHGQGAKLLRFATGGEILTRSSESPDSMLGLGYDLIVFDECAEEPDGGTIYQKFIRPALSDRHGRGLFISTPGYDDWFRDFWERENLGFSGWKSFQMPSGPPTVSTEEIEDARLELPESIFRQQYLAEFLESSGAVFSGIADAAVLEPKAGPEEGAYYVMGVDIAQVDDWTVAVVMDARSWQVVAMDRFQGIPYPEQEERLARMARHWRCQHVQIDATNNQAMAEHLDMRLGFSNVIAFKFSSQSKYRVVNQLVMAFEQKSIKLLAPTSSAIAQQTIGELRAYAREKLPSGMIRTSAPPGKHDDCVMALCMALDATMTYGAGSRPRIGPRMVR
jgi:hypothetical protein